MTSPSFWRYRHSVLAVCTFSYFATRVEPLAISPLIPEITDSLGTTEANVGVALTGLWAAYALVQLPSGLLADRFGERRVIVVALAFAAVGSALVAFAPSMTTFVLCTVLLGAGVGLYYNVGVLLLASQFDGTGRAIGVHRLGSQVAGLVTPFAAVTVGTMYDWRAALLLGAVASVPAIVLVAWQVRLTHARVDVTWNEHVGGADLTGVFTRPTTIYLVVLAAIGEFVVVANMSFLPTFFRAFRNVRPSVAGSLFSLYFVVVGLSHPLFGWLSDRTSTDAVVAVTMVLGVLSHATLATTGPDSLLVVATALAGLSMGFVVPLQTEFIRVTSSETRGVTFGAFRTVYILVGSLGSVVTGSLAQVAGWPVAYGTLAGLFVVALLFVAGRRSVTVLAPAGS